MTFDEIADRWIDWAAAEPKVRALWIEGADARSLRRPYRALRLHVAADQPDYPAVLDELMRGAPAVGLAGLKVARVADAPRFAKELSLEAGGCALTLVAEQSYLLAKRPRAFVVPLVDKTGHLTHVLDFSARPARG